MGIARTFSVNALYQLGITVSTKLASLILIVALSYLLPPEQFGIYTWVISIALIADIFADFGTGNSLIKFISSSLAIGKLQEAAGYFNYLFRLRAKFILLISAVLFFSSPFVVTYIFNNPSLLFPMQTAVLFLILRSFDIFLKDTFVALKEMKYVFYAYTLQSIARVLLVIGLILWVFPSFLGALLGFSIAVLISAIIFLIFLKTKFPKILKNKISIDNKRVFSFVKYAAFANFGYILFLNVDIQMIALLLPIENAAFYGIAMSWAAAFIGLLPLFLILPVLSELSSRGINFLKDAYNMFFKYAAVILVPASFILSYLSSPLIKFLYTGTYESIVPSILSVLAFIILFSGLVSIISILYIATEHPKIVTYIMFIGLIASIILNFILISMVGVVGAAIATVATYVLIFVLSAVMHQRTTGVKFPAIHFLKPLFAAGLVFLILSYFHTDSLIPAIAFAVLGFFAYLIIQFLIKGIDISEIKILIARIKSGN